jgi:hypothetical protein
LLKKIVAALIGTMLAVLMGATAASAKESPIPQSGPASFTITADRIHGSSADSTVRTAASVITCTFQINNAHKSSHVPGTINITASWVCTGAVAHLSIELTLYRNGLYVSSGSNSISGRSSLGANAYTGCDTGGYIGVAAGNVTYPPGYTPATKNEYVSTPSVYISCP